MTDRLYLRISLDTAVSGSIDKQRTTLTQHARPGFVEYVDRSVSGSKVPFAERPAGGRLLADLRRGDRLLVTKIDRAARNTGDLLALVKRASALGAEVVFTEQKVQTDGPMGEFLLTLLGAVAQFEADLIAERRRESLAAFRAEGRHAVGRAPFGLVSVQNPNGRGLVLRPDPETSETLHEVVAAIVAGHLSLAEGARRVGMGGPAFGRLLRNPRLAGVLPSGDIDPDAAVFALVEWDALQERLGATATRKTWTHSDDFGPVLLCGVCGERLYYQRAANPAHATYKCRRVFHVPGAPAASVIRANADARVEEDFLGTFGAIGVMEAVRVSSSDVRVRAIAEARLALARAKAAEDDADPDDDEVIEAAHAVVVGARKALKSAEALPDRTVIEQRPTGETFAATWTRSSTAERCAMLIDSGVRYIVEPGRLPIAEKVHRGADTEPDYLAGQESAHRAEKFSDYRTRRVSA